MSPIIVDSAKVMSKGQITLPKDIREALQLNSGDRVTLVYENGQVVMMNSAVYAMQMLNRGMKSEAEKAGLETEEDIDKLINEIRTEVEN
ncbi:MAG: AbrB/MazE/SpoVT family DNA-binding domain-containing protein [Clostridiales bacterium]|nr:AbrB/MazE/SpoVT family DNA-binding domain-containing protein [Clostridiales bacterium]